MATIETRGLNGATVDRLKLLASSNNRSLEDEVRFILERAGTGDFEEKRAAFLKTSDRIRETTRGSTQTPSEELLREDRDHDHR